ENSELRDRITQLEQDLTQQQIEFQLEVARSLQADAAGEVQLDVPNTQAVKELAAAQERISRLFKELELSQQTAQRQQILVETITEQLESSQERIAQLERDCAFTQQRYNEQVQQLLQAENTCRDLRMRLHRQQRHTLQFKAALEKCLEMPAPYRQNHFMPDLSPEADASAPDSSIAAFPSPHPLIPKNQPVRPWSISSTQDGDDSVFVGNLPTLPRSLSRLVNQDTSGETGATESNSSEWDLPGSEDSQAREDWMNLIFAETSDSPTDLVTESPQSHPIFDLSPFLEDKETSPDSPTLEQAKDSTVQNLQPIRGDQDLLQMLASVPLDSDELGSPLNAFEWGQSRHSEETLWDDLAKLIDPPAASESSAVKGESPPAAEDDSLPEELSEEDNLTLQTAPSSQITPLSVPLADSNQEDSTGEATHPEEAPAIRKTPDLVSWEPRSNKPSLRNTRLHPVTTPQAPFKDIPMPVAVGASTLPSVLQKQGDGIGASFKRDPLSGSWPSPVVYPLRPSKKLKSLAAVELPSFPRAK
ncbi:MAG: hypothetical protein WCA35_17575, partial [Kovacikia sp.]